MVVRIRDLTTSKRKSPKSFSEAMLGDPKAIFYLVDQAGIEGTVSKRADSKYRSDPTSNWLKTKSWTIDEFELLGVKRERGEAAFACLAEPGTGKYRGSAFITFGRDMKDRLWKRVPEHAGPRPEAVKERPAAEWVKPGVKLRVKHLRGDHSHISHASLLGFGMRLERPAGADHGAGDRKLRLAPWRFAPRSSSLIAACRRAWEIPRTSISVRGPAQAHQPNERVSVRDLVDCTKAITLAIEHWCR
ncbi:hypothetical protein NKI56_33215 [Mesorhizobium sp. M0622]|uniref:hypothetical protein n=1 Tax=unclassified Mesorhizobium TaxID=325217 RepID=UPI00333D4288